MNGVALSIQSVSKNYGSVEATKSASFATRFGEVTGLIGPNGAGKTTLIRMTATLLRPDAGTINVCGIDTHQDPKGVRRKIGLLPEAPGLYENFTAFENIRYFSRFYGVADVRAKAEEYAARFDLSDKLDAPAGKLSLGMRKKVAVIRAIIHDPDVIILDEPFSGLDPDSRVCLKELLKSLRDRGKSILVSSHELMEVEDLCDKVVLLDEGRVLVDEYVQALKERFKEEGTPNLEKIYMALRHRKGSSL